MPTTLRTAAVPPGLPMMVTSPAPTVLPGSTNPTPPPDRRLATVTPSLRAASRSTSSEPWVDPRTSAGPVASSTHAARLGASGIGSACSSCASPTRRRTSHPGAAAVTPRSRRVQEVGRPRVGHGPQREREPARAPRHDRRAVQAHRRFVEHAVALAHVARPAGGHDVLPRVLAAPTAGHDVVDALGRAAAVLAAVVVAGEHRAAV